MKNLGVCKEFCVQGWTCKWLIISYLKWGVVIKQGGILLIYLQEQVLLLCLVQEERYIGRLFVPKKRLLIPKNLIFYEEPFTHPIRYLPSD